MEDPLRKMVDLGVGFMSLSREKITESAKQWAQEKRLTPTQTRELVQELVERGERGRSLLQQTVQEQVQKTMKGLGIREDHQAIEAELASLRQALTELTHRIEQLEEHLRD